jgi:aspartyl-tRNA(Asn)/glutamyl-tRNA(Gln) amidotransferase subunit B
MAEYLPTIGVEVHVQLLTETKAFCSCPNRYGEEPNTLVCPVCLGLPGALPVVNTAMVVQALKLCLAVGATVHETSVFSRKNYFYPDLPKGYQISQYDRPLSTGGEIEIELEDGSRKRIRLTRIHLEEDAGKSFHDESGAGGDTLVDLNRCGVPLVEIVTEPDFTSPAEARAYLLTLRRLVRYLRISTGDMEKGALRCDANVSVRPVGSDALGTRTELKNLNSTRSVERALAFEIERQSRVLESGGEIEQQTLLWDERAGVAAPMRGKEESHDYRYFPEPDLVPLVVGSDWLERVRGQLPELPDAKRERLTREYGIPEYDARIISNDRELADYFESVARVCGDGKAAANWVMGEVLRVSKGGEDEGFAAPVEAEALASLIRLVSSGEVLSSAAKEVFSEMIETHDQPEAIIERKGLRQVSDTSALEPIVEEVIASNPAEVAKYRLGNKRLLGFFVGQVMKATKGAADPKVVSSLLQEKLETSG